MIYKYSELKGVIKVGDKVRAVPGKNNVCSELKDDGLNIREVTTVYHNGFRIDGCYHDYGPRIDDAYLELIREPKTLENLEIGDVVDDDEGLKKTILAVLAPSLYVVSRSNEPNIADFVWTAYEIKKKGFKPPSNDDVTITVEGKTKKISRQSAEELNLV